MPNKWHLEENTYVVVGIPRKWGSKNIHGLHRKKCCNVYALSFLSNFQWERNCGKNKLVGNWNFIVK
jgi:hypothetical protein